MLRFGEQLYRPTRRDEETLLIEPYFRFASGTIAAAAASSNVTFPIPIDRAFFLHSFVMSGLGSALSTYDNFNVSVTDATGLSATQLFQFGDNGAGNVLIGDNQQNSGAGAAVRINKNPQLLLPPGISRLTFNFNRSNTTNAANVSVNVIGYMIPPGQVGRI